MIAIVDLKISNLMSVREAFRRVGLPLYTVTQPSDIEQADAVILPGVGAYGDGMASLRKQHLIDPLRKHALEAQKPLIGICLGMHLLAETGEEFGVHEGLGVIKGKATRLQPDDPSLPVPNMGWCDVDIAANNGTLFKGEGRVSPIFYFAHSYHLQLANAQDIAATINYGGEVAVAIERENIFGLQFHPEKSQSAGLEVLDAFRRYIA